MLGCLLLALAKVIARHGPPAQIVWLWNVTHRGGMQVDYAALAMQTGLAFSARTLRWIAIPARRWVHRLLTVALISSFYPTHLP